MTPGKPYRIVVASSAKRDLHGRIPPKALPAIIDLIYGRITENPRRAGGRLDPPFQAYLSARCHPYRVIYQVDEDSNTVTIVAIKPRGEAYHPR